MAVLLSVLMGLVVPFLPGLLRRLLSLCRALFEPGGDRPFPVRVIRGRRQLIVPDLFSGQGLFINGFAPCVYLSSGNGPPPVVLIVDDFHQRIVLCVRGGPYVKGALGGIIAVVPARFLPRLLFLHFEQILIIVNSAGKVPLCPFPVRMVVAPVVVPDAALVLRELPRYIGLGSRRVMSQGKAPAVLKQDGFLDLIALYVLQCLKPPFRPRANVARSSLMLRNKGADREREYSIIPAPAAPSKKPGISSLPGRQIVTAARPFLPHFPHAFPAFPAVPFGLAGFGAVGLPPFGEEGSAADCAGAQFRGHAFIGQGDFQSRV